MVLSDVHRKTALGITGGYMRVTGWLPLSRRHSEQSSLRLAVQVSEHMPEAARVLRVAMLMMALLLPTTDRVRPRSGRIMAAVAPGLAHDLRRSIHSIPD